MKLLRDESGQMLVLAALCFAVLLGFLALAVDVGLLFRDQRNAQIAADSAAVASALDFKYNASISSAESAGARAATANGFTNGTNGAVVNVSCPPADGPNVGSTGFCEAVVSQPNSTFFMGLFGYKTMTVAARAVAGGGQTQGCVWALSRTGTAVGLIGSAQINVSSCNIYDDSNASNALSLTGSGSITAQQIGIVGNDPGYSVVGSGSIFPDPPTTGMAPVASPVNPTPPNIPSSTGSNCQPNPNFVGSGNYTVTPGCYNGISIIGSGTLTFAPGNYVINGSINPVGSPSINMGAGTYIINGNLENTGSGALTLGSGNYYIGGTFSNTGSGPLSLGSGLYTVGGNLTLTGSGPLSGNGVTFYTQGATSVTGSSALNLSAPTSGPYNGLLFYQSAADSSGLNLTGSSNSTLQGIVYAPNSAVQYTGSGSTSIYLDFIVDSLNFTGSSSFQSYQTINPSALLGKITMVE